MRMIRSLTLCNPTWRCVCISNTGIWVYGSYVWFTRNDATSAECMDLVANQIEWISYDILYQPTNGFAVYTMPIEKYICLWTIRPRQSSKHRIIAQMIEMVLNLSSRIRIRVHITIFQNSHRRANVCGKQTIHRPPHSTQSVKY